MKMEEKFEIIKNYNGCSINKKQDENFTIKELREIFDVAIAQGKGNYLVKHEGFCCRVSCIDIVDEDKEISLD